MTKKLTRREAAQRLGVTLAALPLLDVFRPRVARAAAPKRVFIQSANNGYNMDDIWPKGGETDFTFGETLSPLTPYKKDIIVVGGVGQYVQYAANPGALGWGKSEYNGGHDAYPAVLTGVPLSVYADNNEASGGDSIDQFIAKEMKTPIRSVSLANFPGSGYGNCLSYLGKSKGLPNETNPNKLFGTLFGGTAGMGGSDLARLRIEKKSILDFVGGRLKTFGAGLPSDDRMSLDSHVNAIRELEMQLSAVATGTMACDSSGAAPASFNVDNENATAVPAKTKAFLDLVYLAFRCDITRVATYAMTDAGGDFVFTWLGDDFNTKGDEFPRRTYHDITHGQGSSADHKRRKIIADQWFVKQFAYLIDKLKNTPEDGGSMLDNSVLLMTNGMGENHDSWFVPHVLAGSGGGYLKTGRWLKVGLFAKKGVVKTHVDYHHQELPHNGILVAMANAMGVDGSKFGDPKLREMAELRS